MTEINDMTPEQIRLEIAKIKGWKIEDKGTFQIVTDPSGDKNLTQHGLEFFTPDWPGSIAAAWGLVEEMTDKENKDYCTFTMMRCDGWSSGQLWGYEVTFGKPFMHRTKDVSCWASTAPLAICKAYLQWQRGMK
jgi:hypothetical protein